MKYKQEYFYCSAQSLQSVTEIREIYTCLNNVKWEDDFEIHINGERIKHQRGYNKALEVEFSKLGWILQPRLYDKPKLIGDFQKNEVFVEVQFGNSATLYRDYYKFHYGFIKKILTLAVLIVPTEPKRFFPTRPASVNNMADYDSAYKHFKLLPIPVPILLIGLLPDN